MEKPIVQVLRFQNEDVIATSGGQALSSNDHYFALRSEAKQADVDIQFDSGEPWVIFHGTNLGYVTALQDYDFQQSSGTCKYAWYAKNQWWTNGQTVADLGYTYDESNRPSANPND